MCVYVCALHLPRYTPKLKTGCRTGELDCRDDLDDENIQHQPKREEKKEGMS